MYSDRYLKMYLTSYFSLLLFCVFGSTLNAGNDGGQRIVPSTVIDGVNVTYNIVPVCSYLPSLYVLITISSLRTLC